MKLPIPLRSYQICAAAACALLLAGCGQHGPLYLPKVPPASATKSVTTVPAASGTTTSDTK